MNIDCPILVGRPPVTDFRGAMYDDRRSVGRADQRVAIGHVSLDQLDSPTRQVRALTRLADDRTDFVTALPSLLGDMTANQTGRSGHENEITISEDQDGLRSGTLGK